MKECNVCFLSKDEEKFSIIRKGPYRYKTCSICRNKKQKDRNPEVFKLKSNARAKKYRENNRPYSIRQDSRNSDQKNNLTGNDLTIEFITDQITRHCFYCESKDLLITLDRIDNNKAHTQKNVNPCCIRCNLVRGSMPYEAWIELVPKIKEINDKGLFGDWQNKPLRSKK